MPQIGSLCKSGSCFVVPKVSSHSFCIAQSCNPMPGKSIRSTKLQKRCFYSLCKTQSEASLTCSLCIFSLSSVLHLLVHFASRDQICIASPILSFISVLCLFLLPALKFWTNKCIPPYLLLPLVCS